MTRIIKCDGHEFTEYVDTVDGKPYRTRWTCDHCNLSVTRESAMKQLTGKKS